MTEPSRPFRGPVSRSPLDDVADLFDVLSDRTRLRILEALRAAPASVGELCQQLHLKQPTCSKQLGLMLRAGVLGRRREGQSAVYAVRMPLVHDLVAAVRDALRDDAKRRSAELSQVTAPRPRRVRHRRSGP